ncbi:MAG: sel1 repeat family protein [Rhodospirillaceae bacterium]|nr:sel1 repeat family protein [Rhodospirillales bacterium]
MKHMPRISLRILSLMTAVIWGSTAVAQTTYQRAFAEGDYPTAWELAAPKAVEGEAEAQYLLGAMYFDGQGVEQDRCLATLWFDKAARRGHGQAQYRMGEAYVWGYGVYRSDKTARDWMIKARRSGIPEARNALPVIESRITDRPLREEEEIFRNQRYITAVEGEYYPMPHVLLSNDKAASRNFFSPCRGPSPKDLPPRWDKQMKGLPGLSGGMKLFENGEYLAAVDDWVFPAIYGRYEASDVITMLYMTGRLPDANKCLGAIWSQHGGKHQPRVAAYLAQAFAAGWGVRQNPEKAYLWALHAFRKEPFVIDPAPLCRAPLTGTAGCCGKACA